MHLNTLHLQKFKSFPDATLHLGGLTLMLGVNASGKSNIRDAFRFLHGIGRGYSIAEILGGKYLAGASVWAGIRGGSREITYNGNTRFALTIDLSADDNYHYHIEVEAGDKPRVTAEQLYYNGEMFFDSAMAQQTDQEHLIVNIRASGQNQKGRSEKFISLQPVLSQLIERLQNSNDEQDHLAVRKVVKIAANIFDWLAGIRFLDLSPDSMRLPSIPGETHLSDRGENLSSVLQSICDDPKMKSALMGWIKQLTPMDVVDFMFLPDATGKVLLQLVEHNGRKTSAYSASDGTLRFLGILAAVLGPDSGNTFFLEEIDIGIHPSRLDLMMSLLQNRIEQAGLQVIATTHSPQLVRLLASKLDQAAITYRLEGAPGTDIRRLSDIAGIKEAIAAGDLANLHESSWFEDVLSFMADNWTEKEQ